MPPRTSSRRKATTNTSSTVTVPTNTSSEENIAPAPRTSTRKAVTKSASKASLSKKSDDKSFASTATVVTTATTGSRKRKQGPTASTTRTSSLKRSRTLPEPVNPLPLPVPQDESEKPRSLLVVGTGDTGQFGLGMDTLGTISRPRLHATIHNLVENGSLGPNGIEKVAAGGMHSLVLDSNGKIRSCGVNDSMALGRKTQGIPGKDNAELEAEYDLVEGLDGFRTTFIAASDSCSIALSDKGELRAWGSFSSDGILGFDGIREHAMKVLEPTALPAFSKSQICSVACGEDHVLALTTFGTVYTWGNGVNFQLGRKIMERRKANGLRPEPLPLKDIVLVAAGHHHSFAVDKKGVVYAWGLNQMRQCGVSDAMKGKESHVTSPTEVEALNPAKHDGARVIQIGRGEHHTIFLLDNGEVWGCGRADAGRLGLAPDHPAMVVIDEAFQEELKEREKAKEEKIRKAKEAGQELTEEELAEDDKKERIVPDARVPEPVRIAFPPPPTEDEPTPELPPYKEGFSSTKIVGISSGSRYNLAWDESGILYSWGEGVSNQLGLGPKTEEAHLPTRVHNTALKTWKVVGASAGGQHVMLLGVPREEPLE